MRALLSFFTASPAGRARPGETLLRVSAAGVAVSLASEVVSLAAGLHQLHHMDGGLPDAGDVHMVRERATSAGAT